MKVITKFLTLMVMVAALATITSCKPKEVDNRPTFTVGMECAYAPFNWTETSQTESNVAISNLSGAYAEGYDVQVAKILAEELGLQLQIKALEWGALINNLQSGLIDCIIAGMSPTEERMQSIDFTEKYYESTHVLLLKKTSEYASANSLSGFVIIVQYS